MTLDPDRDAERITRLATAVARELHRHRATNHDILAAFATTLGVLFDNAPAEVRASACNLLVYAVMGHDHRAAPPETHREH